MFDSRAYSTGVSLTTRLAIFLMFQQGKVSIALPVHTHFFNRSNIYLLSSTGKRWKTISDILCDCCCSWAQHNIGHSTSNVEQTPSSIARLKLEGARWLWCHTLSRGVVYLCEAIRPLMLLKSLVKSFNIITFQCIHILAVIIVCRQYGFPNVI